MEVSRCPALQQKRFPSSQCNHQSGRQSRRGPRTRSSCDRASNLSAHPLSKASSGMVAMAVMAAVKSFLYLFWTGIVGSEKFKGVGDSYLS
ncbi:hypothetical protein EV2_008162 [Malus domestica]